MCTRSFHRRIIFYNPDLMNRYCYYFIFDITRQTDDYTTDGANNIVAIPAIRIIRRILIKIIMIMKIRNILHHIHSFFFNRNIQRNVLKVVKKRLLLSVVPCANRSKTEAADERPDGIFL